MKRYGLLGIILLLLTACGGSSGNNNANQAQSNSGQTTNKTGGTINITGDVQAAIPVSSGHAEYVPEQQLGVASIPAQYVIAFRDASRIVTFTLPGSISIGQQALVASDPLAPPNSAAVVTVSVVNDPNDPTQGAEIYANDVRGTLNLTVVGATMSGTFEFSATYLSADLENQQEIRKTVTVNGEFSGLPVQNAPA